jgi:flagellar hook-associated protein 3 FlgL
MLTNLDAASELFLSDLGRVQHRAAESNRQISSGKRISTASDSPADLQVLMQLRADRQRNSQIGSNLALAKADAQSADNALTTAIKLMDLAVTLASQGTNSGQTADTRSALAQEVQGIQQEMLAASQTTVRGHYIFSGDADFTPVYELDTTQPLGVRQVSAAAATRRVEDPAGGSFPVSMTAQDIFDSRNADGTPAADNVFAALEGLRAALQNNDGQAIADSIAALKQASARLNSAQSFYGAVENRIQAASDFAATFDTHLESQIGSIEDADVTTAALELTKANTQLQAAFEMRAHLPRTSLFDYLG